MIFADGDTSIGVYITSGLALVGTAIGLFSQWSSTAAKKKADNDALEALRDGRISPWLSKELEQSRKLAEKAEEDLRECQESRIRQQEELKYATREIDVLKNAVREMTQVMDANGLMSKSAVHRSLSAMEKAEAEKKKGLSYPKLRVPADQTTLSLHQDKPPPVTDLEEFIE